MKSNNDIKNIAYEKYKLHWLSEHGYSLTDVINELYSIIDEDVVMTLPEAFKYWENDIGFGSEIWVCFDEFLDNEYLDKEYIKSLLNNKNLFEQYMKDVVLDLPLLSQTKDYQFTVYMNLNGMQLSFDIGISSEDKPGKDWLARCIKNYVAAHIEGDIQKNLDTVFAVDMQISKDGEYVDSDELEEEVVQEIINNAKKLCFNEKASLFSKIENATSKVSSMNISSKSNKEFTL